MENSSTNLENFSKIDKFQKKIRKFSKLDLRGIVYTYRSEVYSKTGPRIRQIRVF